MSIVPRYVLETRAPQPRAGACVGIGAVTAGGVASITFTTVVLAALLYCSVDAASKAHVC